MNIIDEINTELIQMQSRFSTKDGLTITMHIGGLTFLTKTFESPEACLAFCQKANASTKKTASSGQENALLTMEDFSPDNRDRRIGNSIYRIVQRDEKWNIFEMYGDGSEWASRHDTFLSDDLQKVLDRINSFIEEKQVIDMPYRYGLTKERYGQMLALYDGDEEAVRDIVGDWDFPDCNRGYTVFNWNMTGILQIDKIDIVGAFETTMDACRQAEKDGYVLIPEEELPHAIPYGALDTEENREMIRKYMEMK